MSKTLLALFVSSLFAVPLHAEDGASPDADAMAWTPTSEYNAAAGWSHRNIKDKAAYDLGLFGGGVKVGVVDTGILLSHSEFAGRIAKSYSYVTGNTTGNDDQGHGTHVAGIIAAAANGVGSMGVAPQAQLVNVKVLNSAGSGSTATVLKGVNYAIGQGAKIVNLSIGWSSSSTADVTELKKSVESGALMVIAAGNNGGENPLWPARYAKDTWAKGQIIAVGAVDSSNKITSWSNKAGDAKAYYMVAPGQSIYSTYKTGGYAYMSGTSMAAPQVAGAAALLSGYWPKLTAFQLSNIMLATATDLGAPGVDAIYGRGMLNVQAALAPVGVLKLASATPKPTTLTLTSIKASPTIKASLTKASAKGLTRTSFLDEYDRNFNHDPAASLVLDASSIGSRLETLMAEQPGVADAGTVGGLALGYLPKAQSGQVVVAGAAASPYLGFAAGGLTVSKATSAGVTVGYVSGLAEPGAAPAQQAVTVGGKVAGWDVTAGVAYESQSFMGTGSTGALGLGEGVSTFATAAKSWNAGSGWKAGLAATYGVSNASNTGGMILGMSATHGVGFTASLDRSGLFSANDHMVVSLSQPLTVIKGDMTVETASFDENGDASFSTHRVDLAGATPEFALGMAYSTQVGKLSSLSLSAGHRVNADQVAGADESYAMVAYRGKF